jgi:dGTPase
MKPHGGFEHNLQSLRVVDELEERYGAYDGLNLCFETREGVLKHCSPENARGSATSATRFLDGTRPARGAARERRRRGRLREPRRRRRPALRACIDRRRSCRPRSSCSRRHHRRGGGDSTRIATSAARSHETVRRMINELVLGPHRAQRHRDHPSAVDPRSDRTTSGPRPPLVAFSPDEPSSASSRPLKRFLFEQPVPALPGRCGWPRSPAGSSAELFEPRSTPTRAFSRPEHQQRKGDDRRGRHRAIADYIAGMTDRYAILEHRRLFAVEMH